MAFNGEETIAHPLSEDRKLIDRPKRAADRHPWLAVASEIRVNGPGMCMVWEVAITGRIGHIAEIVERHAERGHVSKIDRTE